jgi:sec-independent protein translocase protein TatB
MFGMGGSEILVILIVALLFLGPDKLPDAAKTISKTVRDLKKQTRVLQETIENDEHIGGAIRDLKSALRGDEIPVRPVKKPAAEPAKLPEGAVENTIEAKTDAKTDTKAEEAPKPTEAPKADEAPKVEEAKPAITLPVMAGEADPVATDEDDSPEALASLIKPAAGTVAKNG